MQMWQQIGHVCKRKTKMYIISLKDNLSPANYYFLSNYDFLIAGSSQEHDPHTIITFPFGNDLHRSALVT
jgi:hypothetical protein